MAARAPFTLSGSLHGARLALPLLPGVMVFATAFGAAASQKGLTFGETLSLSAFVFAGAAQMVALEIWRETWTPSALLGLVAVTATINARMILMGAAVQDWMSRGSRPTLALNLFLFTDANWLLGTRYRDGGGDDLAVMFGAGAMLWFAWVGATIPGFLAGALVSDPRPFGLDLVMPVFFSAMLVPLWKGAGPAVPWLVAAAAALTAKFLLGGYSFIVIGALAGALAGALRDERT